MDKQKRNGLYYIQRDGKEHILPSVTAIMGDAMPKPQLIYWAAKLSARAALQDPTITEEQASSSVTIAKSEGAKRGSLVHSLVEAVDNGGVTDINSLPPHIRPYALAHAKFVEDFKPKLIHNEQVVANFTHKYAGRLDRIYEIKGKIVIADFKTSGAYYQEMGLQLSAYKNAEFMVNGDMKPMPKVDQTLVVLLGDDGTYTVKETDEPLEVFLALRKIWLWLNKTKLQKVKTKKESV